MKHPSICCTRVHARIYDISIRLAASAMLPVSAIRSSSSTLPGPSAMPPPGGNFALTYTAGGGAHASALLLQWQIVGVDADFGHDTAINQAGQTVASGAGAGATVKFRTKGSNSSGITYSALKTATAQ